MMRNVMSATKRNVDEKFRSVCIVMPMIISNEAKIVESTIA